MLKFIKERYSAKLAKLLLTSITLAVLFIQPIQTEAAQITSYRAIFRRIQASTASEGITIYFATPTGIQTGGGDTITFTFSAGTLVATDVNNFDVALGDSSTCTTANYTEETVATSPSATEWGVGVSGQVVTLSPETDDTLSAGFCIRVRMGLDAVTGATGSSTTFTNPVAGSLTIAIGGGIGDTGTAAVPIIADDTVTITATVDPTITFSLSDTTSEFGTLSASQATWADNSAGSTTDVAAHDFQVATNAASGYVVTYNGTTLTKGGDSINVATITGDANGTPGTEQFAMSLTRTSGDGTVASGYNHTSPDWNFVENTTTTIYSESGPTSTETVDVHYLANIAGNTPAGAYTANITFIATGTF